MTRAFGITASALFALVEILLLAFFVLGAGDLWKKKLRESIRADEKRRVVLDTVGEIRHVVLRYLVVNVIINAGQAVVVWLVVWALGYPSPILWGILTFIAEFVPFFGGAAMVALLLLTGISQARGVGHAVLAPAAYLVITTLQNNLVSPVAYGRGLKLNPTAILVGVIFWGAVWGIAGVFLAVPLLAAMRIIAERSDEYRPLAVFLAD
jgi:predicted PurR-regulated permease PerM